jgi:hypothetical protein
MNFKKLFEDVIYDSMSTQDLLFEGAVKISKFVDELKAMTIGLDKLDEATTRGNFHKSKLDAICINLVRINKTMEKRVKNKEKVKKADIESIIEGIDQTDTPSVLSILRIVFKKRDEIVYDDEDKQNIHKACQAYDRLVGDFRHYLSVIDKT